MIVNAKLNLKHTVKQFSRLINENREVFHKYFGVYLFPGSVNIKVEEPPGLQQDLDKGMPVPNFIIPRAELVGMPDYLGNGQAWECQFHCSKLPQPLDCWIFRRINSKVPKGVIELVSQIELVKPYALVDGDEVRIEFVNLHNSGN